MMQQQNLQYSKVKYAFFFLGKSTEKVRRGCLTANPKHTGRIQQAPQTTDKREENQKNKHNLI